MCYMLIFLYIQKMYYVGAYHNIITIHVEYYTIIIQCYVLCITINEGLTEFCRYFSAQEKCNAQYCHYLMYGCYCCCCCYYLQNIGYIYLLHFIFYFVPAIPQCWVFNMHIQIVHVLGCLCTMKWFIYNIVQNVQAF